VVGLLTSRNAAQSIDVHDEQAVISIDELLEVIAYCNAVDAD